MKIKINHNACTDSLELYFYTDQGERRSICKPLDMVFQDHVNGELVEPSLTIKGRHANNFLQEMANVCYKEGVRPEGQAILENELTATKYHLEDMRKLALKGK